MLQLPIISELLINEAMRQTTVPRTASTVCSSICFSYEVECGGRVLQDGIEDVYMFLDDQEGPTDLPPDHSQ
jgi:hypothetical protein